MPFWSALPERCPALSVSRSSVITCASVSSNQAIGFSLRFSTAVGFHTSPRADGAERIADLQTLAKRRLWILSGDPVDGYCKVHCSEHAPGGNG